MTRYRHRLPQLDGGLFLMDAGIETMLIFDDPAEFGDEYAALRGRVRHVNVLGGCCGTDHRHIERVYDTCRQAA